MKATRDTQNGCWWISGLDDAMVKCDSKGWIDVKDCLPCIDDVSKSSSIVQASTDDGIVTKSWISDYGLWIDVERKKAVNVLAWQPIPEYYKRGCDGN